MVTVTAAVPVLAVGRVLSVMLRATGKLPATVGMPVTVQLGPRMVPVGRVPDLIVQGCCGRESAGYRDDPDIRQTDGSGWWVAGGERDGRRVDDQGDRADAAGLRVGGVGGLDGQDGGGGRSWGCRRPGSLRPGSDRLAGFRR